MHNNGVHRCMALVGSQKGLLRLFRCVAAFYAGLCWLPFAS